MRQRCRIKKAGINRAELTAMIDGALSSDRGPMPCDLRSSTKLAEFTVEMMIHLNASRSVEDPGVLAFPKVLICLNCGASRFTTPDGELRILRERTRLSAA
jgi:hypothetical protein